MACLGCEIKEKASQMNVDLLVKEQLALEMDLAEDVLKEKRIDICEECEHLNQHTCSKCGCFVLFRASLNYKSCPIKKW
ncbi:DUF6171 family protein [Bacillus sp. B1-b2]|uniref:DUF6171 family protein n=1 Tax=Bacillus sp. B1-b2 TaxID=2653201 RepID=UPI001262798E|nr:DUF6171 family protein [Bacillus sp. B1-b2]KAB7672664.1 hypothetical protein F9279_03315 [Bacillus sp. B1-b2]